MSKNKILIVHKNPTKKRHKNLKNIEMQVLQDKQP